MKFRHNKKRNTAFLFEALIREVTKAVAEGDKKREANIIKIIKEHFSKSTELARELKIYKCLLETSGFDKELSKDLLAESKKRFNSLDRKKVFVEQNVLINKINKQLGGSVFSNFVPQYKDIATIYQIFNKDSSAKQQVILERQVVELLTREKKKVQKESKQVDSLVVRTFFKKFNEKYNKSLLKEQKEVLKHFISDSGDNIEFKLFLNEEIGRIKAEIKNSHVSEKKSLLEVLGTFREHEINYDLIEKVIKLQQLVHEIKEDGN
jgi:hypothetical protein